MCMCIVTCLFSSLRHDNNESVLDTGLRNICFMVLYRSYIHVHVHYSCLYIVVAVPKQDSMSPARANAAPVWALHITYAHEALSSTSHTASPQDLLVTVFENGDMIKEYSFDEIRERAELPLVKEHRQKQQ